MCLWAPCRWGTAQHLRVHLRGAPDDPVQCRSSPQPCTGQAAPCTLLGPPHAAPIPYIEAIPNEPAKTRLFRERDTGWAVQSTMVYRLAYFPACTQTPGPANQQNAGFPCGRGRDVLCGTCFPACVPSLLFASRRVSRTVQGNAGLPKGHAWILLDFSGMESVSVPIRYASGAVGRARHAAPLQFLIVSRLALRDMDACEPAKCMVFRGSCPGKAVPYRFLRRSTPCTERYTTRTPCEPGRYGIFARSCTGSAVRYRLLHPYPSDSARFAEGIACEPGKCLPFVR